jgi:hypothetical protein
MDEQESFDIPALKAQLLARLGSHANVYPVNLERDFPRILAKIVALWSKPALDDFLSGLMVSDRPGRQGFPPNVAMEIFRLSTLHGSLGFTPKQAVGTGWSGIQDAELYKHGVAKGKP